MSVNSPTCKEVCSYKLPSDFEDKNSMSEKYASERKQIQKFITQLKSQEGVFSQYDRKLLQKAEENLKGGYLTDALGNVKDICKCTGIDRQVK